MKKIFNIISNENSAKIYKCSSFQNEQHHVNNLLHQEKKKKWVSKNFLPQEIIFDLTNIKYRPSFIKAFGIQCSEKISSNPKKIEILLSTRNDDKSFFSLGTFEFFLKTDVQLYTFEDYPIQFKSINYLKVILHETFGDCKTYLNQFFIFEELEIEEQNIINTLSNNNTNLCTTAGNIEKQTISTINNKVNNDQKKHMSNVNFLKENLKADAYTQSFETRITTIENEISKINFKLDKFLDKVNNSLYLFQTQSKYSSYHRNSQIKLRQIHEKKMNVTMNYLDNKINNFRINFDKEAKEEEDKLNSPQKNKTSVKKKRLNIYQKTGSIFYEDLELKTQRIINLSSKIQQNLTKQTKKVFDNI